jgi:hypothetical protein
MARDNGFNLLGSRGGGKVENRGNSLALTHNRAKNFINSHLIFCEIKVFCLKSFQYLHKEDFTKTQML